MIHKGDRYDFDTSDLDGSKSSYHLFHSSDVDNKIATGVIGSLIFFTLLGYCICAHYSYKDNYQKNKTELIEKQNTIIKQDTTIDEILKY